MEISNLRGYSTNAKTTRNASTQDETAINNTQAQAETNTDDAYALEIGNNKNETVAPTYTRDNAAVNSAFNETEEKSKQLMNLVNTLFSKQAKTNSSASIDELASSISNLKEGIKNGSISVDQATIDKAKADVAEDGYYGVEQTSERLVGFAKALSGGDPSKLGNLRDAIVAGFELATKKWGEELPQISKDTFNATMDKLDKWASESGISLPAIDRM